MSTSEDNDKYRDAFVMYEHRLRELVTRYMREPNAHPQGLILAMAAQVGRMVAYCPSIERRESTLRDVRNAIDAAFRQATGRLDTAMNRGDIDGWERPQ